VSTIAPVKHHSKVIRHCRQMRHGDE